MKKKNVKKKPSREGNPELYKNPNEPVNERVKDLLSKMTLEEKAAQMMCIWQQKTEKLVDEDGNFDFKKAKKNFGNGNGIGQIGRLSDAGTGNIQTHPWKGRNARQQAKLSNDVQKFFREHGRLGIPVIIHEECLHGQAAVDGTSFPQPIALAATFNPELVESLYSMVAQEARLRGTHQALTPVVDVARDARWGRVEETFGEDPFLVSRMGIAACLGFQGDAKFNNKNKIISTLKHFAAHGQPESGMNCAPVNVSERVLRETFLFTFKECIEKANAISVMPSYNEIDGVPSHANRWLLRDVLRKEWNWKGFAVSDYYAIWELGYRPDTHGHFVAQNKNESAVLSVKAGVNIELPEPDCYLNLVDLVKKGELKESELDNLVEPLLFWKFQMGLFEDPYVDPDLAEKIVGSEENRKLALKGAHEAIILLKNEKNFLPLNLKKIKKIAVIGPNANRSLLGGYSGIPKVNVTVLDGIKTKVGDRAEILYHEGCKITVGGSWTEDNVAESNPEEDRKQIAEAIKVAEQSDVIVLAIGGNEQTSREAWGLTHLGDRTNLDLVGRQNELVEAMVKTGKPVIVFLFHGRPNSINYIAENVQGIFECFYIGQETGNAVADALFGDINPSGKLPITIPRSVGHLPVFYNYKPSARRGYLFDDVSPLFSFGFGLSYSTFKLENVKLAKKKIKKNESTTVSVEVTNLGKRAGAEVVQMYIRDVVSSVTRPIKELKGFQKVFLQPNETKKVKIEITPESLAFWDINMKYVVEAGDFEIMVGTSSRNEDLMKVILKVID